MDQRPWWERLFDRDSPAGPIIVIVLFILAIALVLTIGPMLDRWIQGEQPASYRVAPAPPLAVDPGGVRLVWCLYDAATLTDTSSGPGPGRIRAARGARRDYRQGTKAGGQQGYAA